MSTKEIYKQYVESDPGIPLFFQPQWLDLYQTPWQVIMAEELDQRMFLIYFEERKMVFRFIRNPQGTPYHGILPSRNCSPEMIQKLACKLLQQLPDYDELHIDLLPGLVLTEVSPFKIKQRRTNILTLADKSDLFNHFKPSLQRQIRKAQRHLSIEEHHDPHAFYTLYETSLKQRRVNEFLNETILQKIITCCKEEQCGKLFRVYDREQQVHATLLLVFDKVRAYYLLGGTDKQFNGSGAMSYLMWHAIQYACDLGLKEFDFEGSDQDSIHRFFQNFNPKVVWYTNLQHQPSKVLKQLRKWQQH